MKNNKFSHIAYCCMFTLLVYCIFCFFLLRLALSEDDNSKYYVKNSEINTLVIPPISFTNGELSVNFCNLPVYQVDTVIDGDTIKVIFPEGKKTIRLVGVDTPETVHPKKGVQPYGKEASNFTKNLLAGEQIYFVTDTKNNHPDKYGRLLGYVFRYPDGLFVNLELVRQGYAKAYLTYPFDLKVLFKFYEEFACRYEKGLWKEVKK